MHHAIGNAYNERATIWFERHRSRKSRTQVIPDYGCMGNPFFPPSPSSPERRGPVAKCLICVDCVSHTWAGEIYYVQSSDSQRHYWPTNQSPDKMAIFISFDLLHSASNIPIECEPRTLSNNEYYKSSLSRGFSDCAYASPNPAAPPDAPP